MCELGELLLSLFFLRVRDMSGTFVLILVPQHLGNMLSNELSQWSPDMSPLYCV